MFGFIKSKKKKLLDDVATSIGSQIHKVLEEKEDVFTKDNYEELIFFVVYLLNLYTLLFEIENIKFDYIKNYDSEKYILDSIDSELWAYFVHGSEIIKIIETDEDTYQDMINEGTLSVFSFAGLNAKAEHAAINDCRLLRNNSYADNLYRFLTGKELLTYNE